MASIIRGGWAQIDEDVASAFLFVDNYAHDTRSMQAIIEMSQPYAQGGFLKSSLPPFDQLNMHVDAVKFLKLAKSLDPINRGK
jgi:hypothetical protein